MNDGRYLVTVCPFLSFYLLLSCIVAIECLTFLANPFFSELKSAR